MTDILITDIAGKIVKLGELDEGGHLSVVQAHEHELHDGKHFFCGDLDSTVDIATPKFWLLQAPNPLRVHLFLEIEVSGPVIFDLIEEGTVSANGNTIPIYNSNRNSGNTSGAIFTSDPSSPSGGTAILTEYLGTTGKKEGVGALTGNPLILKSGANYFIKITAEGDGTLVCLHLSWTEVDHPT